MFGKNEIVGRKFFREAQPDVLHVTSLFYTIQGEGPHAGKPAVFLRLAKCNLACSFCDTFFDKGDPLTFAQIMARVYDAVTSFYIEQSAIVPLSVLPMNPPGVGIQYNVGLVVTGGEPALQKNLTAFLRQHENAFAWTQIETNGTMPVELPEMTTMVVSPKCAEVDGKPTHYLQPSDAVLARADCLKFVVSADEDSPYHVVPGWALEWKEKMRRAIFVSPMNVYNDIPHKAKLLRATKDEITLTERSTVDEVISFWEPGLLNMAANQRNHEYAARYCLRHNLRLSLQTHLYVSLA